MDDNNKNKKLIKPQTLKGFRDFLPDTMRVRKKVIAIFSEIFEKYGFEELQTPALEYQETLLGKYGEEAEKLMYLFKDTGQREVGLRYDLTVPTARVVAQYPNLPKPFKRYQIQSVWRAEKPQKGRYREVTQCDIDTFGTNSPLADAEIITVISECLTSIGFKDYVIRVNSRGVLFKIMENAGVQENKYLTVIQSIDKLDKKPQQEVEIELTKKGFSTQAIKDIFNSLKTIGEKKVAEVDANLGEIFRLIKILGVNDSIVVWDNFLARGLDYYTGAIFETVVNEPKIGSITGGGRYDNLIGQFIGQKIPAVGTTLGLDRAVDVITELNLWSSNEKSSKKILITVFSKDLLEESLELAKNLRQKEINAEVYLDSSIRLDRQLKYADQKCIPYVVIIGPDEVKNNCVTLKNMQTKEQKKLSTEDLIKYLKIGN